MEKDGTEVEVTVNKVNDSFWHKITPRFSNFVEEITKVLTGVVAKLPSIEKLDFCR